MKKRQRKMFGCLAIIIAIGIWTNITRVTDAAETAEISTEPVFTEEHLAFFDEARVALKEYLAEKDVMALVYLVDHYALREAPDDEAGTVVRLNGGQQVQIQDVVMTQEIEAWVQVKCTVKGQEHEGYVNRQNLACSDEMFLQWENTYGMNPAFYQTMQMTEEGSGEEEGETDQPVYADVELFPESYQNALYALKEKYPNWVFVKMNTELVWDTVVAEELKNGRSLIHGSQPTAMKEGLFGQKWYYASEEALEYYLDPRNRLTEDKIFQFEQLTYNESYHTDAALQKFLDSTFMKGNVPDTVMTYAYAVTAIGKQYNVSPFHLASRVYQEQGDGTSPLISGTYPGYEGYYNYYNIGATGSTDEEVIKNGLEYAKKNNWNSHYYSLHFGAEVIAANYIAKGQDTLYLQKFDVDSSDGELYWHQYMQNIGAPDSEGNNIKKLYESAGALDNTFVFKIPVYEDMPETACEKPLTSNRVVLDILDGYEDLQIYMDGKVVPAVKKNGYYVAEAPNDQVKTAMMYRYDEKGVSNGMAVWELMHDGSGYVINELEGLRDVLDYQGFAIRITGKSGIRYVSGILRETKKRLIESDIEGYTLKEYGTMVLPQSLLESGELTFETDKVAKGLSYGTDGDGNPVDTILRQTEDRDCFTTVLVGLPVDQYKKEFAFRSYAVLQRDGKEIVIYGVQKAKSIYELAKVYVEMGLYQEGSNSALFLEQLINDADIYEAEKAKEDESASQDEGVNTE